MQASSKRKTIKAINEWQDVVDAIQDTYLPQKPNLFGDELARAFAILPQRTGALITVLKERGIDTAPLERILTLRVSESGQLARTLEAAGAVVDRLAALQGGDHTETLTNKSKGEYERKWDKLIGFDKQYRTKKPSATDAEICAAYRKDNSRWAHEHKGEPTVAQLRDARRYRKRPDSKKAKQIVDRGRKNPHDSGAR